MIIGTSSGVSLKLLLVLLLGLIITTNIGLIELIQDRPRSLIIDIWNLGHNLACSLSLISRSCSGWSNWSCSLSWRNLSGGILLVLIILLVEILIWRIHSKIGENRRMLLVIVHPRFLKEILQISHSISIRCIKSISPESPELTLCHGLRLFHLLRIQRDLVCVDSSRSAMHTKILRFVWRLSIRIIVVSNGFGNWFGITSLLILLGDSWF